MNNETYIFDNGNVYTMVDGKVTSSVKESEFQEPTESGHQIVPMTPEHAKALQICMDPNAANKSHAVLDPAGNPVAAFNDDIVTTTEDAEMPPWHNPQKDVNNYDIPQVPRSSANEESGHQIVKENHWDKIAREMREAGKSDADIENVIMQIKLTGATGHVDSTKFDWRQWIGETEMPNPPEDIQDDLEQQSHEHGGINSRVTTPNGLSGKVLGRVSGMWGDEVTVRFDNGRIVSVPVNQNLTFHAAEKVVEENPTKALEARLAQSIDGSKESLENRVSELKSIRLEAAALIQKGAAYETEQELDRLRVEADYELGEVHAALEHLNDAETESFTAPAPFRMQAVEQESVGSSDSTWLDSTVNDMISEAEATDFGKLMDEGPEAFTAGLDAPALAEAGITRSIASRFINSKTAAANPELRQKYEQVWLARVEECRKAELLNRKETTKKEAASQEEDQSNLPDDVLFT